LVILFAGKFEAKKQPDLLIEAVVKANQKLPKPIKLLMVGNGPLETELKELAKQYEFIQFLPFQNQSKMPIVYRLGDVFCLPSKGPGETWGLAVNEAMACGRPVIVSDKVGCAEDLLNKNTGWILPAENLESWTLLLKALNQEHLKLLGNQSRDFIRNWSFGHIVKKIDEESIWIG
jgi:glycosyltransferase involved in cell wall biosynthesis